VKYFVRDRRKNVLWEGDDHIKARHAYRDINLRKEAAAYDIVDERGHVFGTRNAQAAGSDQVSARAWVKFALPQRLIELMRAHAKTKGGSLTAMVDGALAKRRELLTPIDPDEKRVPFRISVPVPVRTHLERVAMETSSTLSAVGELAIYAWCEELEAKRAA